MTYEVEKKFAVPGLRRVHESLLREGAVERGVIEQSDCYYAHPATDYAVTGEAFRMRRVDESNYLTYKGPRVTSREEDGRTKIRREIELEIEAGEAGANQWSSLIEALGFRPVLEVRKCRSELALTWRGTSVDAALDEVTGLGSYVELEVVCDRSEVDSAQAVLSELTRVLELGEEEPRTYLEMLLESKERG